MGRPSGRIGQQATNTAVGSGAMPRGQAVGGKLFLVDRVPLLSVVVGRSRSCLKGPGGSRLGQTVYLADLPAKAGVEGTREKWREKTTFSRRWVVRSDGGTDASFCLFQVGVACFAFGTCPKTRLPQPPSSVPKWGRRTYRC